MGGDPIDMILNLISLTTVKAQLGLSDTTHDADITAMIPIVSSDVRRILNNNFDRHINAVYTKDSDKISSMYCSDFQMGQVLYGVNIPDDTYIKAYDPITGVYTLSANATDDGSYLYPTLTIAQWGAVSKMIWYRISSLNTSSVNDMKTSSETYGPVSKTYAESEINKKWNYPQSIIDDLGTPYAKVG